MRNRWYVAVQGFAVIIAVLVVVAFHALGEWPSFALLAVLCVAIAVLNSWRQRRARAERIPHTHPNR
jgi:1,4-dihydroxy-2-naphthoate octaprenyltransferase